MELTYKKTILRHYNNPSNKIDIKTPTEVFVGANPFCGDKIEIKVKLDAKKKITDISWSGNGCVISQASASIFTDMIRGKTLAQAQKMTSDKLLQELNIELSPSRRKCALLPLYTIKEITDEED
ncbi:iron-sulfur cluster assembly scaffold protein [Candidatus Falkowbacteria bacterium]|uniref:Fe-S cluster protein n=1 Tax=Candidatus Buchananbacteria bacterium CG10_big_fil_rev_8_21_14_0_10_33_19 TaxID=1974525 RepID=A0A2H0W348_9BACT|nr:iron-sulfur cluster assembly scaffold protein [Candidatus Falkowbacteria bacterium]PIS05778.1 MAG: Fe-S cluster protein [Candidatus Buchananbacteria bacterium CG10_big_fil_rev_8_21_14_0_10_33_19]